MAGDTTPEPGPQDSDPVGDHTPRPSMNGHVHDATKESSADSQETAKPLEQDLTNDQDEDATSSPEEVADKRASTKSTSSVIPAAPVEAQSTSITDVDLNSEAPESPQRPDNTAPPSASVSVNGHAVESGDDEKSEAMEKFPSRPPSSQAIIDEPEEPASPPKRRLMRSPFSFFSRNSSSQDKLTSRPSFFARRGTASSVRSYESGVTQDAASTTSKKPERNSLKDRFKLLRMQEEAGIKWTDESNEGSRPGSSSSKIDVATMLPPSTDGDDASSMTSTVRHARALSIPVSPLGVSPLGVPASKPVLNEGLAPGTAAGTSTGPAPEQAREVDWDLWQAVVYEGPAAVARTSPAELNEAIAHGIPSAIRGVVWQVLAQSQSSELETIYTELVKRTGEPHSRTTSELKPKPTELKPDTAMDKSARESIASSASSMHSALSEPDSPANEPAGSPVTSQDADSVETAAKAQAAVAAEASKRQKEEASSLTKLERAIRRDLGARTSYSKFLMSAGLQNGLFGICKAYALYDEDVGYAQGMNFIAMPLLFNMPEEEAFCLFVRLMNKYGLRDMFIHDMPGLHLHLYQFERLLEDFEPALYCHLHRRGVNPQLYATQWFLTLFAYRFPLQLVLRIYDLILSEGLESAILKFGVVLMQKNKEKLLEMRDMSALTQYLKERLFDVYIDQAPSASSVLESGFFGSAGGIDKEVYRADALVQDACAVQITPEMLKTYTNEWKEKTREEKQKLAEEDHLRTSNAALTTQVRQLEERHQKYDAEHVQIASSLVKTQLDNQKLSEDNESMRVRIAELQRIVTEQPRTVEETLRAEMDRIMQRNVEVQNANRHLEENLAEMEHELVQSKMRGAQTDEELEEIKAKWHSVSAMMNGAKPGPTSPRLQQ